MKLNWVERWVVNNPLHVMQQRFEVGRLKEMMALRPGFRALEVGCGRGAGASLILKEFQPTLLHALDLDIQMVQIAKRYLSPEEREKVSLCAGDIFRLPFKDGTMDAVFGFGVLHHAVDWRGSLAEIARVLKTGGAYFTEEYYPSLYQNFITKRILLHPTRDRFFSRDLREAMKQVKMPIRDAIEFKKLGILGVAVKGE